MRVGPCILAAVGTEPIVRTLRGPRLGASSIGRRSSRSAPSLLLLDCVCVYSELCPSRSRRGRVGFRTARSVWKAILVPASAFPVPVEVEASRQSRDHARAAVVTCARLACRASSRRGREGGFPIYTVACRAVVDLCGTFPSGIL